MGLVPDGDNVRVNAGEHLAAGGTCPAGLLSAALTLQDVYKRQATVLPMSLASFSMSASSVGTNSCRDVYKRQGKKWGIFVGTVVGCLGRFVVHYISGVTIYKILAPTEFMKWTFTSPSAYSLVYNGSYMLPNTIIALDVYKRQARNCPWLRRPWA